MVVKAILVLLVATPVCAALAVMIAVLSVDVLIRGESFTASDVGMALIFGLGSLVVVGLGLSITYRRRDQWAHKAIGVLLALGTLAGIGGGTAFAAKIIGEKRESMAYRVHEACATARRDGRALPNCEDRAPECIYDARGAEAPVQRGLMPPPDPADPDRPRDPEGQAIDDCLRR